jgi:Mor family transcriptional regulator
MSIKLSERNEALYNDWKLMKAGKMKMWELIAKYHISVTRINYLVNQERLLEVIPSLENEETI